MPQATLRQVGGSTVIALPPALLDELGLSASAKVSIRIENGKIIIEPKQRPRYSLDELLAICDLRADLEKDELDWQSSPRVGREEI